MTIVAQRRITGQDGDVTFAFRSGRPCLDFAATLRFRSTPMPDELLRHPRDVVNWAAQSGLVDELAPFPETRLAEVCRVREAAYAVGVALATRGRLPQEGVARLNRAAAVPPPVLELTSRGRRRAYGDVAALLSALARDAIDLATGPEADRVRQCQRDGCTRLFVDRSRGANRVWCGMEFCGNRVNAAAYRRRRAAAP